MTTPRMFQERPDSIEWVLAYLHTGTWFDWTDNHDKSYANLVVTDQQYSKPTEAFLNAELVKMLADYDNAGYIRDRIPGYPDVKDQLDMIYHDLKDSTTTWADAIAAVKTKYPKP